MTQGLCNPTINTWTGCYPSAWKGIITPEAFQHPAKFSSRLIERIYRHALDEGWLKPGDRVVDPFGGVAIGAYPALRYGLHWEGCELEPRFVDLGNANIDLWNARYAGKLARWGTARLLQGDSRELARVIGGAECAVSSPPYADISQTGGTRGLKEHGTGLTGGESCFDIYGSTPGQLGALPAGDYQSAVSSPPYNLPISQEHNGSRNGKRGTTPSEEGAFVKYGNTPGQLEGMPDGDYRAAISSPPFESCLAKPNVDPETKMVRPYLPDKDELANYIKQARLSLGLNAKEVAKHFPSKSGGVTGCVWNWENGLNVPTPDEWVELKQILGLDDRYDYGLMTVIETQATGKNTSCKLGKVYGATYGIESGQLGNDSGETFWTAARAIIEQVYTVLAPGGHAMWVVKGYVKNKQLVDFPGQWREVCEACGFVTLHEHRALLVNHKGTSYTLDGETVEHKTESKSFFRRLAEKNGSPRIDWETVLCMEKHA